jgi:hypothetical protein
MIWSSASKKLLNCGSCGVAPVGVPPPRDSDDGGPGQAQAHHLSGLDRLVEQAVAQLTEASLELPTLDLQRTFHVVEESTRPISAGPRHGAPLAVEARHATMDECIDHLLGGALQTRCGRIAGANDAAFDQVEEGATTGTYDAGRQVAAKARTTEDDVGKWVLATSHPGQGGGPVRIVVRRGARHGHLPAGVVADRVRVDAIDDGRLPTPAREEATDRLHLHIIGRVSQTTHFPQVAVGHVVDEVASVVGLEDRGVVPGAGGEEEQELALALCGASHGGVPAEGGQGGKCSAIQEEAAASEVSHERLLLDVQ